MINFGATVRPMTKATGGDHDLTPPTNLPPGLRITGLLRERVIQHAVGRYDEGAAIRVIASELNRPYTTTHRLLAEGKARMRPRGTMRTGSVHSAPASREPIT